MQKTKNYTRRNSAAQLQRAARERADDQARRIPWQRLYDARNQYIDWQEFTLWARSILEVEEGIPDWLAKILNDRCPGFVQTEEELTPKATRNRPLPLRLEDWIDDHIFGFAKQEGWFNAVTFYAIREPRYQRAEVCCSECTEKWKKAKPILYPSFEEWKGMAAQCDETAHLTARERKARASAKLVHPDRLTEAATRYMDCEALAYWARHALEQGSEPPAEVVRELKRRCPGYLDSGFKARAKESRGGAQDWPHMMLWIADHFFRDAKTEGWFEAVLIQVRSHPRAIRTMEFSDYCSEIWGSELPSPYPPFEDWRRDADSYVGLDG
ncbi:MAG: hypothetical protein WBQ76_12830 [Candidatus Korobacteraceae bacterium]